MMATPAPPDTARSLLRGMLRIRMIEERIKALYAEQEMRCPTHFSIGQEAAAVGVCARLTREEPITSAHRSHAHYLAKGGDLKAMLAELYGKVTGCARGKGGSMHLIDRAAGFLGAVPIVGATIPIGVGAAPPPSCGTPAPLPRSSSATPRRRPACSTRPQLRRHPQAADRDGVREQSLFRPHVARWRHPNGREIAQLARGHGALTLQGDGNDADVVHALAGEAVEHARGGRGPVFVELATYRWLEHCGPNDDQHLGYRPPGEFAAWQARDPLKLYTERLRARRLVTDADLAAMTSAITTEIDEAVEFARSSPFPARQELAEHVYAP